MSTEINTKQKDKKMAKILQDVYDIQYVYGPGANVKLPGVQTITDKKNIINNCKQTIDNMKKLFQTETNLDTATVNRLMENKEDMARFLENASNKVKRIVEIISNQKDMIIREQKSIAVFKKHAARQQSEMERMRKQNQH